MQKLSPHAKSLGEADFRAEAPNPALLCVIDERGVFGGPYGTKVSDGELSHMGESQTAGAVDEQPWNRGKAQPWPHRYKPVSILVR